MSVPAIAEVGAIIPCSKCCTPHVKQYKSNRCIECKREGVRESHRRAKYKHAPKAEMIRPNVQLDPGIANHWLRLSLRAC